MSKHDDPWLSMMTEQEWDELHPDPRRDQDLINWNEANDYVGDGPDEDALEEGEALMNDIVWALTSHGAGLLGNAAIYSSYVAGAQVLDIQTDNGHQYRLTLEEQGKLEVARYNEGASE